MNNALTLPIIGYMRSPYVEKFGIPRQPNLVDVASCIVLSPPYDDVLAFTGIEQFSHLWLLWHFHDNKQHDNKQHDNKQHDNKQHHNKPHGHHTLFEDAAKASATPFRPLIRPPRLGGNQKIGVFASRSMYRPAPIGLSVVKLLRLEQTRSEVLLWVSGADLLNGTPIFDIKPYIAYSDAIPNVQSGYAQVQPARKTVLWSSEAMQQQQQLTDVGQCHNQTINALNAVLALDPRPAYQDDASREYGMAFANLNVRFCVNDTQVIVHSISAQ